MSGTAVHAAVQSRVERVAQTLIRRWCGSQLRRHALLHVEGLEHIPSSGPALLVCRHVHHVYDGCVLLTELPRSVHLLIALDWLPGGLARASVARMCRMVRWPVVLRSAHPGKPRFGAPRPEAVRRSVSRSFRSAVDVLVAGDVLGIFPEAYPNVDPVYTPKHGLEESSPFLPGFASIADLAQSRTGRPIPVIPVGFFYERGDRWRIRLRCGAPLYRDRTQTRASFVESVQSSVLELSRASVS